MLDDHQSLANWMESGNVTMLKIMFVHSQFYRSSVRVVELDRYGHTCVFTKLSQKSKHF